MASTLTWPGEHVYDGVPFISLFPAEILDTIKTFNYADEDIVVATYPKTGTTWVENILLKVKEANNPATPKQQSAETSAINMNILFLEMKPPSGVPVPIELLSKMPSGRLMRTHVQQHFFASPLKNRNTKFIICMRNIKDTLVSFYHFTRNVKAYGPFTGSWDEFFDIYKARHLPYGDPIDYNLGWWKLKDNPNILFLKYEDLKKDPKKGIQQVALHVGETLTDEQVSRVMEQTTFDALKKEINPRLQKSGIFVKADNAFFRKGIVGDWKNYFSKEQEAYVNRQVKERLEGTGLNLQEEI